MSDEQDRLVLLRQAYTALTWAERAIIQTETRAASANDAAQEKLRVARVYVKRAQDLIDAQIKGAAPKNTVVLPQASPDPLPSSSTDGRSEAPA